jgi:hypothetical protein
MSYFATAVFGRSRFRFRPKICVAGSLPTEAKRQNSREHIDNFLFTFTVKV